MIKQEFIKEIRVPLKNYGFHKKGAYWFKKCNDIIFCVNVQGSQWNKDNYYFAIGGAEYKESCPTPTIMHWLFRHRCKSNSGELNIPPQAALSCVSDLLDDLTCLDQLEKFLRDHHAAKVVNQYWF